MMKLRIFIVSLLLSIISFAGISSIVYSIEENTKIESLEKNGYYKVFDGLYVNYLPGVYKDDIEVEFVLLNPNDIIYYSLDHSNPTTLYNQPIKINTKLLKDLKYYPLTTSVDAVLSNVSPDRCFSYKYIDNIQNPKRYNLSDRINVITVKLVDDDGNEKVRTLTYLHNDYSLPVVSLSMEYDEWFGNDGFYNKIREDISKRVNLEYFDSTYNEYFYANSKIKLGGNWSLGYPQRTLNLNFNKDQNDVKNDIPKTHIFGDRKQLGDTSKELVKLTRFRLHNGGNCFEAYTGFNDAVLQNMMAYTNASTTAFRPCIAYLNGEYWGMYYLREHYSDTYFIDNYDVDKDTVAVYEYKGGFAFDDGDDSDFAAFFSELFAYLKKDFSDDTVYEEFINTYIDVDSLIDVFIAHSYASNWDFVGNFNNLKMWRTTVVDPTNPYADGRLRFCLHDIDFAFTEYTNYLDKNHQYSYSKFEMFGKLLENEQFKARFYQRAEELLSTNLSAANAYETLNEMILMVKPYKLDAMVRWGDYDGMKVWLTNVKNTYNYFNYQEENYLTTLRRTLSQY